MGILLEIPDEADESGDTRLRVTRIAYKTSLIMKLRETFQKQILSLIFIFGNFIIKRNTQRNHEI